MITLTEEQKKAHDLIIQWTLSNNKLLTLGGFAGSGKTTLLGFVASTLKTSRKNIAFCAISGKASTVLKSKLNDILTEKDYCGTVHSLIYRLIGKEKLKSGRHELYFGVRYELNLPYDLIILDEASMVNEYIFKDLVALGIPILAVGDHAQLPPVKGSFNLMHNPQIRLEKIMRQAESNSIITASKIIRENGNIEFGAHGNNVYKTRDSKVMHDHEFNNLNSIVLCALNKTRVRINSFARQKLGIVDIFPQVGEPLICLYNNHRKMVYNGNIGILKRINDHKFNEYGVEIFDVEIDMGDFTYTGSIDISQFGKEYTNVEEKDDEVDYFDWGYCLSVWKAQGSEWGKVLFIEEGEFMFRNKEEQWRRFLYTGITRAKENLIIYKS